MEIDKEYIDTESALRRIGGNMPLYIRLLSQFVESDHISSLEHALKSYDDEKAARDAHTIKGVGANLSLGKLTAAAAEVERKMKEGQDCKGSLDSLKEIYKTTVQHIKLVTDQASSPD